MDKSGQTFEGEETEAVPVYTKAGIRMVGASGFEPPASWSRTRDQI
jgi:hypothetical protein